MASLTSTEVLTRKPQNLAVQTNPAHDLNLVEEDVPEPGPTECLVHVRATGICGSDVHFWKHGHIGSMVVCGDNGLGHESSGVIIKIGKEVTRFKLGKCSIMLLYVSKRLTFFFEQVIELHLSVVFLALNQLVFTVARGDTMHVLTSSFSRLRHTMGHYVVTMYTQKPGFTTFLTHCPMKKVLSSSRYP
jgi:hypothetical protein